MQSQRGQSKPVSRAARVARPLLSFWFVTTGLQLADANVARPKRSALSFRGGSTRLRPTETNLYSQNDNSNTQPKLLPDDNSDDDHVEIPPEVLKRRQSLQKYRVEQQMLMQLRSTMLSEALAKRGLPVMTMMDVSTAEGDKPPEMVDWDCAMSTRDQPKSCLYSFDAEPNTKVIAPLGTTQWISLSALNRMRRTDPTKVEPMWHSKYSIHKAWFGDDSPYSILQHCGPTGLILSLLLDNGVILKMLLTAVAFLAVLAFFPVMDSVWNRILVSSTLWGNWPQWARIVHAALPLKILLVQLGFKALAGLVTKAERRLKSILVDLECSNLEYNVPLTVGPGSDVVDAENDNELEVSFVDMDDDADDDLGAVVLDEDVEASTYKAHDELADNGNDHLNVDDDDALDQWIEGLVGNIPEGEDEN